MRLARLIPAPIKPMVRSWYLTTIELADRLPHRRNRLYPPAALDFIGDGAGFTGVAHEFLNYHIELGHLKPDAAVLDVGCGIGRMAAPLTKYLHQGTYDGFDIVELGIRWSRYHISRQYPNFRFQHADIYHELYNPKGKCRAAEYRFPYPDASFDYVFLTSVLTHLLPADMNNYLHEVGRVLKPHGRALITYFLLNDESRRLIAAGASHRQFAPFQPECWTIDRRNPEVALAYDEPYVREAHVKAGLELEPIRYGSWPGRKNYLSYQDITCSRKIA